MILILIIIITEQTSPQNRHFIFASNKPFVIMKLKLKEKEIIPPSFISTLSSSHSLPSSQPFPSTDCRNMCTYVKMNACIYANIRMYVRASNKHINTKAHKLSHIYTQVTPTFRTKN